MIDEIVKQNRTQSHKLLIFNYLKCNKLSQKIKQILLTRPKTRFIFDAKRSLKLTMSDLSLLLYTADILFEPFGEYYTELSIIPLVIIIAIFAE